MNLKKAKAARKIIKNMVANGYVNEETTYTAKRFSRPAQLDLQGKVIVPAYEVYTATLSPSSAKGAYRRLKRQTA